MQKINKIFFFILITYNIYLQSINRIKVFGIGIQKIFKNKYNKIISKLKSLKVIHASEKNIFDDRLSEKIIPIDTHKPFPYHFRYREFWKRRQFINDYNERLLLGYLIKIIALKKNILSQVTENTSKDELKNMIFQTKKYQNNDISD